MDLPRAWMRQLAGAAGAAVALPAILLIVAAGVVVGGGGGGLAALGQLVEGPSAAGVEAPGIGAEVGSPLTSAPPEASDTSPGGAAAPTRSDSGSTTPGTDGGGGGGTPGSGGGGGGPGGPQPPSGGGGGGGGEAAQPPAPDTALDDLGDGVTEVTDTLPAPIGPVTGELVDGLVETAEDLLGAGSGSRRELLPVPPERSP